MTHLTTFRKDYLIRLARHDVQFCKVYPITELDDIILELLSLNGNKMKFTDLGLTLGFAVKEIVPNNIHYDHAEVNIFENLLEPLQRYHLITVDKEDLETRWIQTTHWGKLAKIQKRKRLFFQGTISLPEHFLIHISEEVNAYFPFKRFGINSAIIDFDECDPFEIDDMPASEDLKIVLANRNLEDVQGKNITIEIVRIEQGTKGYNSQSLSIDISLLETSGSLEIETTITGVPSPEFDELIQSLANQDIYQDWFNETRYNYFLESSTQLTAEGLKEYTPFVVWSNVLGDERVVWDEKLLNLLSRDEIATHEIWTLVSDIASKAIISEYLEQYQEFWNWYILSDSLPVSYILAHTNDYDWDYEALIKRLDTEGIEFLLRTLDDCATITDWTTVTKKVTKTFLQSNISKYPFDLYLLSKNYDSETEQLVYANFNLDWDWSHITRNWPFSFIIEYFGDLSNKLNLRVLLNRVLSNPIEFEELFSSEYNTSLLQERLQYADITYSSRDNIILNEQTLNFLHRNNLIFWGHGNIAGIEANSNLIWTTPIFRKYCTKVETREGYKNVSSSIPSLEIIDSFPHFPWDFNILAKRSDLSWSFEFIRDNREKLSTEYLLSHLPDSLVIEHLQFFVDWYTECDALQELSAFVSKKLTFAQIKANSKYLRNRVEEIDWKSVLRNYTHEELNKLSFELEEDSLEVLFITELWSYLAEHCKLDFILEHPEFGWDWQIITESRIEEYRLNNNEFYSKYAQYLYWPYLISEIVSSEDLAKIKNLSSISVAVSKSPESIKNESWRIITRKIPRNRLWKIISDTEGNENFTWDWNIISSMDSLPISHQFLNQYANKLNWKLLSKNQFLNDFFRYDRAAYRNVAEWVERCMEYIYDHKEKWDFKSLSHLDNLTWNVSIVSEFEDKWDWEIIVLKSNLLTRKNNDLNLIEFRRNRLQKYSDRIDWKLLSSLFDVRIPIDLIDKFSNQNWDWSTLSAHPKFEITNEFLIAQKNKPWDYQALTTHPKLDLNKNLLLELGEKEWDFRGISSKSWIDNDLVKRYQNKNWDWADISANYSLIPDVNLLKIFTEKEDIEWQTVLKNPNLHITLETLEIIQDQSNVDSGCWNILSTHANLDIGRHPDILQSYKEYWNWRLLIGYHKIDINDSVLLKKFQTYLDWEFLSQQERFCPTEDILSDFKALLNWKAITKKIHLSVPLLEKFKDYLDWSFISDTDKLEFTPEIIEQFKFHWDYFVLKKNVALSKNCRSKVSEIIQEIPELEFYFRLKQQNSNWSGNIYHFTHIQNALKILDSKKILSRNKAEDIADAAGSVVHRRATSHDYARFYFRPQTPTQYYNECLGADIELRSFEQAKKLGLPKCPVPVFFKFNLQEILLRKGDQCFISNGNMQTNWAKEAPLMKMYPFFNFKDLYSTIFDTSDDDWRTYIRYSQQEFLIKDVFEFSELKDYQIIVNSDEARQQLSSLKSARSISHKIVLDQPEFDTFHNGNKEIDFSYGNEILNANTNYKGDGLHHGEIQVRFTSKMEYEYLSGDIQKISNNTVSAYPDISLYIPSDIPFELSFYDDLKNESWLIYQNSPEHQSGQGNIDSQGNLDKRHLFDWWYDLDYQWKKLIFLNFILSKSSNVFKENAYLDDSYGLEFLVCMQLGIATNNPDDDLANLERYLEKRLNELDERDIEEFFLQTELIIEDVQSLLPLNKFKRLNLVFINNSRLDDVNQLKNLENIKFYEISSYSNNSPSLYHEPEEFISSVQILENPSNFVQEYYGITDYGESLIESYEKLNKFTAKLDVFIKENPQFRKIFQAKVRHYTIHRHTELVCQQFDKYFGSSFSNIEYSFFKTFLILHDIGKPIAFQNGDKSQQHLYTQKEIQKFWPQTPFSSRGLAIVTALASGDPIGEYMQDRKTLSETCTFIISRANEIGISNNKMFRLFMIYYQCDTAAYTADAGGIKFLEHLYEYEFNTKSFDYSEGLLKFKNPYNSKYLALKERLNDGNTF